MVNAARPCGAVCGRWRPGPNPGVVELTIALYRGFGFPRDALVFGIGHQGYVHRPLARRQAGFGALRQPGAGRAAASGSERRGGTAPVQPRILRSSPGLGRCARSAHRQGGMHAFSCRRVALRLPSRDSASALGLAGSAW
ncbi:hypothetical protein D7231_03340 [Streptomyces klenkii]|uniref:Transketolase signature 1 domain-containing protein n=1 Tax=Streptomyces klenkii TaxID=1420899 RepID=A0A3B0BWF3_9ACTN|nr:hypothetical protein D7231_03340 [Streptomyces klenkii]